TSPSSTNHCCPATKEFLMQAFRQKVQLNVDEMEDRMVPSSTPLLVAPDLSSNVVGQLGHRLHLFIPQPSQFQLNMSVLQRLAQGLHLTVPDLAGVNFRLDSVDPGNTSPPHELDIQSQTYNADGSVTFTGMWIPLNPPGGDPEGSAKPVFNT